MSGPGYVFKDGGPIPDDELAAQKVSAVDTQHKHANVPGPSATSPSEFRAGNSSIPSSKSSLATQPTTDSHALAGDDHAVKGAAQQEHFAAEVKDLGWKEHPEDVPKPLIGGLPNEELWLLVRRFNKQVYHVKHTPVVPLGGLDLEVADQDEFSPDKLRANLERLYMTVIVGVIAFGKHIARLRSWREPRRTVAFATVYFLAWAFDLVVPMILSTVLVLIVYPPARSFMFPPAPLALVDHKSGGVQSPRAGVLGSTDSVTGAPEKHKGEAVEQEAGNFVSGFATIAMSSAAGKHEPGDPNTDAVSNSVPDPTSLASVGADAKASAQGDSPGAKHDKTKEPMEEALWSKMRPIMHVVGDISDGWERFANALSPTHPFPQDAPRLKLGALLVPGIALSLLTTSYMFVKMSTFFVGVGFFADPVIWRLASWLNREFPNWRKLVELRNTILKGVPTNAQLTLTLLRIGEANKAPIPPPPRSDEPPPSHPADINKDDVTVGATNEEIHNAINKDPNDIAAEATEEPKKKHGSRILAFFKGTTKAGVESKLGLDKVRATVGSSHAKEHLGILPEPSEQVPSGPVEFKARYQGKKGWVYINTSATIPCVSFSTHSAKGGDERAVERLEPVFSIPIAEIRELKKVGGLGWKSKLVVGWATDRTVADGLEIVDKNGKTWRLTAMLLRDELFNRLMALGPQKWESW